MFLRFVFCGLVVIFGTSLLAQELTNKQRNLGGRYAQLEQILLRLSETSGSSNPRQAALLKRVLLESKDKLLVRRFETLANILERRQLSDAVNGQMEMEQDLLLLLKLLESENRNERREEEKEKIKEFLKDLEEILQGERTLRNQTQQQETPHLPTLEKNQQQIRHRTEMLRDRIAEQEGPDRRQTTDNRQQESQQDNSNKEQPESSESQSEQSEQSPQKQESSPSQQAMQQALERMKQAEQKLKAAEKAGAIDEQEEAIAQLQRFKEELEKILRQLREEELMQSLEKLEERFKRMLRQEQAVRSQTERLISELAGESAPDQRQMKIRADRLGIDQQSVIDDAESALVLLRDDGTAQAMAESLVQARFDMVEVKNRLERTVLDTTTLHIEDAVIDSLQEMLSAVQAAIEEARQRQENADNQQQSGGGTSVEEPLSQVLAELRMIRSMQQRVNERTKRYDDEIKQGLEKPEADLSLLKQAVEELARQQNRISRILHDLRIGREK